MGMGHLYNLDQVTSLAFNGSHDWSHAVTCGVPQRNTYPKFFAISMSHISFLDELFFKLIPCCIPFSNAFSDLISNSKALILSSSWSFYTSKFYFSYPSFSFSNASFSFSYYSFSFSSWSFLYSDILTFSSSSSSSKSILVMTFTVAFPFVSCSYNYP